MKTIIALLLSATGAAAFSTGVKTATIGLGSFATAKYPALPKEIFAPAAMTAFPVEQDDALAQRRLEQANQYKLIKSGAECNSDDAWLGDFNSAKGCADKCTQTEGCRFFIYGIAGTQGDKTGSCYHEKTSDGTCSEDWESDSYDFYVVLNNVCTACPSGYECATNTYVLDNECTACPSGYTCDGTTATKVKTAAERAECLAGSDGSCDKCCKGITGECKELTQSGVRGDVKKITLTEQDDCVLLKGAWNKIDATSPRLKRPWLIFASARRVGNRRRRRDRRRGRLQQPLRQRLPRPSEFPTRRRLVRARAARRSRRRFAHA